jgi:hypothetical protein
MPRRVHRGRAMGAGATMQAEALLPRAHKSRDQASLWPHPHGCEGTSSRATKGYPRNGGYARVDKDWYVEPRWVVHLLLDVETFEGAVLGTAAPRSRRGCRHGRESSRHRDRPICSTEMRHEPRCGRSRTARAESRPQRRLRRLPGKARHDRWRGEELPTRPQKQGGHGFVDASRDPDQIAWLWRNWPAPLIGMRTGTTSSVSVLDVDQKHPEAGGWWR